MTTAETQANHDKPVEIAHHEASHATMAFVVGFDVLRLEMAPNADTAGLCVTRAPAHFSDRDMATREILSCCAGIIGERLLEVHRPTLDHTSELGRLQVAGQDMAAIVNFMADPLCVPTSSREAYLLNAMDLTRRALQQPNVWRVLRQIAIALLKTGKLSGEEVLALWCADRVAQMAKSWIDRELAAQAA